VAQVVECLPGKNEALSSNPSTTKKKKKKKKRKLKVGGCAKEMKGGECGLQCLGEILT
jgi:hypothetical protein